MFQHKPSMHGHGLFNHFKPSMKRVAFEVALKERKQIAEGTVAFTFQKPDGFPVRAGQHIRMTLLHPPETGSEDNHRFFSLVNAPHEEDLVIAMRMRDTAFKRVLGEMPIGGKVRIETLLNNPHSSFALHTDASKPAVFLIGGIGIVPAFALIKDALERKLSHPLFLFYANRRPEDAPFLDELQTLAAQNPTLTVIATMTKPTTSAYSWQGERGYIDFSMIKRYIDQPEAAIYYIAGLPKMVRAMQTMLTASGIRTGALRSEEFAGFSISQTESPQSRTHRIRPLPLLAMVLIVIAIVGLHIIGATFLSKISFSTFSLSNPFSYIVIGLLGVLTVFKLKHGFGFIAALLRRTTLTK